MSLLGVENHSYLVDSTSRLTVGGSAVTVGRYITVRAEYQINPYLQPEEQTLVITMPESIKPVGGSVTMGGEACPYSKDDGMLYIYTGESTGVVRFYCLAEEEGTFNISGGVRFTLGDNLITQPIGSAEIIVNAATIIAPDCVGKMEIPVSGKAINNSTVRIFDNGVPAGETVANKAGTWSYRLCLADPENGSRHGIYAVITTPYGAAYKTETSYVFYDESYCEPARVTMLNTAHPNTSLNLLEFRTVFDYQNPDNSMHTYNYWPSYPDFTFIVEMIGQPDSVQIVTTDQHGDLTTVDCVYDKTTGNWIGTHKYTSYSKVPCSVAVSYTQPARTSAVEFSGQALDENIGENHTFTVTRDRTTEPPRAEENFSVSAVCPSQGGAGIVTLELSGTMLEPNAQVELTDGTSGIPAQRIVWVNHRKVYATFDLSRQAPGSYGIRVTCHDDSAQLSDCFTLDPSLPKGRLSFDYALGEKVKTGEVFTGAVTAINTGYTDVSAPVVVLSGENILLSVAVGTPESESVSLFLQSDGLGGTVLPGKTAGCDFAYTVPEVGAFTLNLTDYRMLNTIIPAPKEEDGSVIPEKTRDKLLAMMGDTYPEFAVSAAKMADALTPVLDIISLDAILSAYLQNLNGPGSEVLSESTIDLASLELGLSRSYVSGGGVSGLFGTAWSSGYEITAGYYEEDGAELILISDSDSVRFFAKDESGTFVNLLSGKETAEHDPATGTIKLHMLSGETMVFNAGGYPVSNTDVYGNQVVLNYSGGVLSSVSTSNGDSITFTIDGGKIVSAQANTGDTVSYTYSGDLLASVTTKYSTTAYTYNDDGQLTRVSYVDGSYIDYRYDSLGRVIRAGDSEYTVNYSYGLYELASSDNMGRSSLTRYDTMGNAVWSIDTNGDVSYAEYDDELRLTRLSSGLKNAVSYVYDENGMPVAVTPPGGSVTSYTYDGFGGITSITDAKGQTTGYERDANGATTAIVYPDASRETLSYDEKGQISTATDRAGVTRTYSYDASGNVTKIQWSSGESISYTYDGFGNVTSITENGETTALAYNSKGDLVSVAYPNGKTVTYTYDSLGRKISVSDGEFTTGYLYNAQGQLSAVTDGADTLVSYEWNPDGSLHRQNNANGTKTLYTYALDGSLTEIRNLGDSEEVLSFFRYTYNKQGLITSMEENDGTWTYRYDAMGQLTRTVSPEGEVTEYAYDAAGNRTSETVGGQRTAYSANSLNQYTSYGDYSRSYDANGNLVSEIGPEGNSTYEWDYLGRLSKATIGNNVYEYGYDTFGLRISVTENGNTMNYLNDPTGYGFAVASWDGDGVVTHYANAGGIAASRTGNDTYYYNSNHLGSVTEITGTGGAVVNRYVYNQEGNVTSKTEGMTNPYTYVGIYGIINDDNGLIYDRARYVSAETMSFISADLAGQYYDLNMYRYCGNDIIEKIDLDGEKSKDIQRKRNHQKMVKYKRQWKNAVNYTSNLPRSASSASKSGKFLAERIANLEQSFLDRNIKNKMNSDNQRMEAYEEKKFNSPEKFSGPTISAPRGWIETGVIPDGNGGLINLPDHESIFYKGPLHKVYFYNENGEVTEELVTVFENGEYSIRGFKNVSARQTCIPKNDPSGYVYAGAVSNRIEGVTATIYYEGYPLDDFGLPDYDAGLQAIEWTEASEYDEVNPQISDYAGQYGWDVLEGRWRVHFTKDGFQDHWTEWMDVPPEYTDVNINLLSKENPFVKSVSVYPDEVRIEFSQYMDIDVKARKSILVTVDGVETTGKLEAVNAESNYEGTAAFASVFRFVPKQRLSGTVAVTVRDMQSYAGMPLAAPYSTSALVRPQLQSVEAPINLYVDYLSENTVTVQILPAEAGANLVVTAKSSSPSILLPLENTLTADESGCVTFRVIGMLPGTGELSFTVDGTELSVVTKTAVTRPQVDSIVLEEQPVRPVWVSNGLGSRDYSPGETVYVSADEPAEGYVFQKWSGVDGIELISGDISSPEITFVMPDKEVKLGALYEKVKKVPDNEIVFTTIDGTVISRGEDLKGLKTVCVSISVELQERVQEAETVNIFFAVYDSVGKMILTREETAEIIDSQLEFSGVFDLPSGQSIGSVSLFLVSEDLVPVFPKVTIK